MHFDLNAGTFKIMDTVDTGDYFSIATTNHGATTITTVDDDNEEAHLNFVVDGDVTFKPDASGEIKVLNDSDAVKLKIAPNETNSFLSYGRGNYFGPEDGASATLQHTLTAHNVAGGDLFLYGGNTTAGTTNDIAGGDLILGGGQGKGTGAGGGIQFKVAPAAAGSASSLNSYVTPMTISTIGKITMAPPDISGVAFHLDANADSDNEVQIDAGILDIDVTGATTLDTTELTVTGKTNISTRKFTVTGTTHFEYQGDVLYFGGGSTTQGNLCYLKENGEWGDADADGAATGDDADRDAMGMLAIALGTDPDVDGMFIKGVITLSYDLGDVGNPLYVKTTAGAVTHEAPTDSGDFVRVVGYCLDDTNGQMYFNPDSAWVEIA